MIYNKTKTRNQTNDFMDFSGMLSIKLLINHYKNYKSHRILIIKFYHMVVTY